MTVRLLLSISLATAIAAVASAQPRTAEFEAVGERSAVDRTTQTEDVEFHDDGHDRMTVPVSLQGTGPYRFLVDTGADRTAISRELAAKLKLRTGLDASVHTVGGVSTVSTATISALRLTRRDVSVIDAPLLKSADMGADGILGVDSLRSQKILFDFEGRKLSIFPASNRDLKDERGSIVITATRRNGRLVVTQARANDQRLAVILDTGAQVSIGNKALRQRLFGNRPVNPASMIQLTSVTGEVISGECLFLEELEMGGVHIKDLAVVFADSHAFRRLQLDHKPAMLLGMNAMRAFKRVSIDFANRKFRVILPEESSLERRFADARMTGKS